MVVNNTILDVMMASRSYFDCVETVEIKTIEDLKELDEKYGQNSVIVEFSDLLGKDYERPRITIYDEYIE